MFEGLRHMATIIKRMDDMHTTLRGQAKGLRRLHNKAARLTKKNMELLAQRQNLLDLLDSRDHDIMVLKLEIAEFQPLSDMVRSTPHPDYIKDDDIHADVKLGPQPTFHADYDLGPQPTEAIEDA